MKSGLPSQAVPDQYRCPEHDDAVCCCIKHDRCKCECEICSAYSRKAGTLSRFEMLIHRLRLARIDVADLAWLVWMTVEHDVRDCISDVVRREQSALMESLQTTCVHHWSQANR